MMLFRDYIEILWQCFIHDAGYLQTLRDKIKSEEWNKEQMYDPAFEDWKSIDPRNPETYHGNRMKFHPTSSHNPQQGIYTYESREEAREKLRVIRECLSRRRERDKHQESKG